MQLVLGQGQLREPSGSELQARATRVGREVPQLEEIATDKALPAGRHCAPVAWYGMGGVLLQHVHFHVGFGVQDWKGLAPFHGGVGPDLGGPEAVEGLEVGLWHSVRNLAPSRCSRSCSAVQRGVTARKKRKV